MPSVSLNFQMSCYEDAGRNPALRCTSALGVWLPANSIPGSARYNAGAQIGVCAGFSPGSRMTPPVGELLAETGVPVGCKKCP